VAATAGRVVVLGALWSVVSFVLRPVPGIRRVDDVFGLVNLPVGPSAFSIVLLFIVGGAVRRRIRSALWLLLAVQALGALYLVLALVLLAGGRGQFASPSTYQEVYLALNSVVTAALLVVLPICRDAFPSRLEPGARLRALAVLVSGLAVSVAVSIALSLSFPGHLTTLARKIAWSVRVSFGLEPDASDVGWLGQHGHHWAAVVAGLISAASLVAAALVFLRSARAAAYLSAQDELAVRGLLLRAGERDSLGYFATRHDKSVVFGPERGAALTYRVVTNVSLASADPIGPPAQWAGAINEWLAEARRFGWFPAVLAASEDGARAYTAAGLKALPIGDEAIIDVDGFTLEGPTMQQLRQAVRRVDRAGYRIEVRQHADLSAAELAELDRRAQDWRGEDTERGFSMALGRVGDPADGSCVAVLARDGDGQLRGFLSMVPWGRRGLSLDLMRRDRRAENGLTEALVVALIEASRRDLGVTRISLNFAMFRGIFSAAEQVSAGPVTRATSGVMSFASRFWQIETLYRSNARYLPRWEPRYLCYDSALTLTRVAVAAGMAEGFLPAGGRVRERAADGPVTVDGRQLPFAVAVAEQRENATRAAVPLPRLSEQQRVRHRKLDRLRAAGMDPYPEHVARDSSLGDLRSRFGALPPDTQTGERTSVAGRVRALRDLGGLTFVLLQDEGAAIQVMLDRRALPPGSQALFRATADLGDILSVTGQVVTSRRGELSVLAEDWQMASKCLTPIPDLRTGFTDPDARARRRHLDLLVNADARELLEARSAAVAEIRRGFASRGFLEVETPMLQQVHGGATARPFVTHINAYDQTLYLRIAPELYLKRLCVGGFPRIFELNRNFRNEGADATHNPEFTSVEAYQAFSDYLDMRELTREVIQAVAVAVHGKAIARRTDGAGQTCDVDLSGAWRSVTVHEAVSEAVGTAVTPDTDASALRVLCARHEVAHRSEDTPGELVSTLYEALVEKHTTAPTFYLDFPTETSPLTRRTSHDPRLAARWDLVAFGAEIGTAYSELVDPVDQRERFVEQSMRAANGDLEAMQVDEAFLSALDYAMPPTGGLGIGVDRLVMMLTGASIRQTLAFPFVRPGGRP
jgi:lysyl-tRNA synthetase class 2